MSTLEIRGLAKRYGTVETLKRIDLALADGEFLVLLGPSGCGKSTLLNLIAGLIEPSAGDILIDGRSVLGVHPKDRDIAMVFQSYALYPNLSVARNIGFALEMRGTPAAERQAAVGRVAEMLQITGLLQRRPAQLSGGQRQRVAIGRALVRDPKVFLFDEPLSNLDAKLRLETRTELKRLHQQLGTTVVYVTHDQIEAMTLATRIAVMSEGRIVQLGTPEEVYERPANLYVAGFMGSPPMNLVPVTLDGDGRCATVVGGGGRLAVPPAVAAALGGDGRIVAGIRPEWFRRAGPETDAALDAVVEVVELTGPEKQVVCRVGATTVIAGLPPRTAVAPGETLALSVAPADIVWFDPVSGAALPAA